MKRMNLSPDEYARNKWDKPVPKKPVCKFCGVADAALALCGKCGYKTCMTCSIEGHRSLLEICNGTGASEEGWLQAIKDAKRTEQNVKRKEK